MGVADFRKQEDKGTAHVGQEAAVFHRFPCLQTFSLACFCLFAARVCIGALCAALDEIRALRDSWAGADTEEASIQQNTK